MFFLGGLEHREEDQRVIMELGCWYEMVSMFYSELVIYK
mgnify:FL=1